MASIGQGDSGGEAAVALPSARTRTLPAAVTRPRWWLDALVIVWLAWVYDIVANLAPLRQRAAVSHGEGLLHLERVLHVDPELALNRWLVAHHTLGTILSYYYDNAHFVVTFGLLGWLWWRRADLYRPLRNALVLVNVIGLVVFWLYPVAPPRMLRGFTDVIASSHTFGSWHTGSLASAANQFAAMPSLHMAWAAWCALVLWRLTKVEGPGSASLGRQRHPRTEVEGPGARAAVSVPHLHSGARHRQPLSARRARRARHRRACARACARTPAGR
jgi:hypothetical protein